MRYILVLIGIYVVSYACTQKETTPAATAEERHTAEIVPSKNIKNLPIDAQTSPKSRGLFHFEDKKGNTYLTFLNENTNAIQFYDLKKEILSHSVKLQKEGPDGVGKAFGFHVKSLDSIFITSKMQTKLYLVNQKGKVLHSIDYTYDSEGKLNSPFYSASVIQTPLIIKGNKLYLSQRPRGYYPGLSQEQLLAHALCLEVDMKENTIKRLPLSYPETYWEEGKANIHFSRIFNGNQFVYAFEGSHQIYTTKDHQHMKAYDAKSKHVNKIPVMKANLDMVSYLKEVCTSPAYGSILYDPYRKVYYRFVYPGMEINTQDNLKLLAENPSRMSIVLLDEHFNKIGESTLADNTYLQANAFVAKEGLYISRNHPLNPELDENKLTFELFELKQL